MIDVNTGSFTGRGKGRLEDTITKVNVEAADEVVRQLRLRDIGGIIVIDFIDMARARNRDQVLKTLRKALDADKTKSYVMDVSPLGLVEMTRQNVTDGVREILTKRCPTCDGEGVVKSEETVAIQVVRRLRDDGRRQPQEWRPGSLPGASESAGGGGAPARGQPAARARGGVRQALPLRGRRRAAAGHLRDRRPGHPGRDRGACAPVPGRRRGPGADRGAAHVQRRRRGRPGGLATSSASPAAGASSAIDAWCGSRASGARRRPHRWSASRTPIPARTRRSAGEARGRGR